MPAEADEVASIVLDLFSTLPAKRKPCIRDNGTREWVPLAGIVARHADGSLKCLALAYVLRKFSNFSLACVLACQAAITLTVVMWSFLCALLSCWRIRFPSTSARVARQHAWHQWKVGLRDLGENTNLYQDWHEMLASIQVTLRQRQDFA